MIHKLYLNNFTQDLNNISQTIMVFCFSLEHVKGLLSVRPTIGNDILNFNYLSQNRYFGNFRTVWDPLYKLFPVPLQIFMISSLHNDVIEVCTGEYTGAVYDWLIQ